MLSYEGLQSPHKQIYIYVWRSMKMYRCPMIWLINNGYFKACNLHADMVQTSLLSYKNELE